jgi:hypothetical protein
MVQLLGDVYMSPTQRTALRPIIEFPRKMFSLIYERRPALKGKISLLTTPKCGVEVLLEISHMNVTG